MRVPDDGHGGRCRRRGGVFFAFSVFVMQGLRAVPPADGMAAMQAINRAAPSRLHGRAAGHGGGVRRARRLVALRARRAGAVVPVVGCGLYLVAIVVTAAYHIPRNNALDTVDPDTADAARRWAADAGRGRRGTTSAP